MSENTKRAFIHFGRSWYARHNNHRDGMIDMVTFGDWHEDGSGDNEISVVWYVQGPRLECFNGSWAGLANMPTVIAVLGALDGYKLTALEFCEILIALDFEDRTPADRFGTIAPMPAGRSDIVNVVVERIMDMGEPASLVDEIANVEAMQEVGPLVNVGDVLYYYARRDDSLAISMAQDIDAAQPGWFICTVTGRPSALSALVEFQLQDGEIRECEIETRRLYPDTPRTAGVINLVNHYFAKRAYYHASDYGWLQVMVRPHDARRVFISASMPRGQALIVDELVNLADLAVRLPQDVIALNVPILGERQNGMPDWLICPNCEIGQTEVLNGDPLITCLNCHFEYIRPPMPAEEQNNAM